VLSVADAALALLALLPLVFLTTLAGFTKLVGFTAILSSTSTLRLMVSALPSPTTKVQEPQTSLRPGLQTLPSTH
jgi:hypothetical protein